jgi:hypothetical protein
VLFVGELCFHGIDDAERRNHLSSGRFHRQCGGIAAAGFHDVAAGRV